MRHATAIQTCLAILAMGTFLAVRVQAADIRVTRTADRGIMVVSVEGELKPADGARFAEAVKPLDRAAVVFNSPGGSLLAGLQMGRLIRLKHFATWVPDGLLCASACASAWLAGTPRAMQPGSHIGFHAAFIEQAGQKIETGVGNALAGAYFSELGLSADAIIFIEKARPDDLTWLTPEDAVRLGIKVSVFPPGDGVTAPPVAARETMAPDPASARAPDLSASLLEERARGFADKGLACRADVSEHF